MSTPWRLSLSEGVRRLRERTLTASAWVRSLLDRIDACEERVQAWVRVDREGALATAERIGRGEVRGGLAGAPVGIKDIIDVKGLVREAGSPLFKGYVPQEDSIVAARLRAAGAVILGKTVTTQFANPDPAPTRNPWDPSRSPGGSSSGSAAAVACGMVPAALGSQTGGSVIGPASFCGVVGLKPTRGRVPLAGVFSVSWTLDHLGILSRTAEDAALLLTHIAGADPADDASADAPVPDYVAASAPRPPRRVLFLKGLLPRTHPEIADAALRGAARLREAGAEVAEGDLPFDFDLMHAVHRIIMRAEAASYHETLFRAHPEDYAPTIRQTVLAGFMIPAVYYLRALRLRARFARELENLLKRHELLLLPSMAGFPPPWGPPPDGAPSRVNRLATEAFSHSGLPCVSLPAGRGKDNLPMGLQLGGRRFGESDLLAAARWCEEELGWRSEIANPV
ncbi:MAG: amidase [Nitrospinota bacterium]